MTNNEIKDYIDKKFSGFKDDIKADLKSGWKGEALFFVGGWVLHWVYSLIF